VKTFALVVLAAAVAAPAFAQQDRPEAQKNPFAGNAEAIAAGQRLYNAACISCHGPEARGDRGPALANGSFRHGALDGEIFLNIRGGIKGTGMPAFAQFSTEQIWQVISYLRSLNTGGGTTVTEKVSGDPAAGKAVFNGKGGCIGCHQVNGQGTPVGPNLSAAASIPAAQLEAKILNPNQMAAGGGRGRGRGFRRPPVTLIIRTTEGQEYRGVRKNEDSFSIQMVDTHGQMQLLERAKIASLRVENHSIMPSDFGKRLSPAEIQNVVAYLKTLNGHYSLEEPVEKGGVTVERITHADREPQNWLTYWGDYHGQHYSSLNQINASNVKNLQAQWAVQMPGDSLVEGVPIVVDGIMYATGQPGQVFALDARTGRTIWTYQRRQKVVNPYESNRYCRGVAILGNRLFFGTLDAALVALDARTGAQLWETQVANTMEGYSITGAPLIVNGKVITGVAGGEYGILGFVDAYDPASGKRLWRFNAIPEPGEFGHDTWEGESWKHGSGATWLTGTYDPESDTLFWPVGNPGPDVNEDVRKGDNLFSCSVLALDPQTGKRKWHYQFTPHDSHDWDSTEDMVLVDRAWHGENRKLILHADRNGVFYVLDRTNGKMLAATPFVRTTWVKGWDENGRPITNPNWGASADVNYVYPALGGGSNFQAPSYNPRTGWLYLAYHDGGARYAYGPSPYEPGKQFWGRGGAGGFGAAPAGQAPDSQGVMAIDPETGKVQWKFELAENSLAAGVLSTAGDLVFSASREGNFIALDAKTGKALWHFGAGADLPSSPMSYAVNGRQYVAVSSAGVLYSFALPE
jgi:PQQ-dependent dehydrogenase (methanol/ethanol family)